MTSFQSGAGSGGQSLKKAEMDYSTRTLRTDPNQRRLYSHNSKSKGIERRRLGLQDAPHITNVGEKFKKIRGHLFGELRHRFR